MADSVKLLDNLIDTSKHQSDSTNSYLSHQYQQQLEKDAISRVVDAAAVASNQSDLINANLSQHIASELVAIENEALDSTVGAANGAGVSGVVCGPSVGSSVLAAAAVVAASEVQALSDSNQLTAANLHQTVTTAAAVAVAATEAVLADSNNNTTGPESQPSLTAIPAPPNQAAVAMVASQSMINDHGAM